MVDQRPSYEELAALVLAQAAQIDALTAEVAELRRRLEMNSSNSSRPPSTDSPFVKPAPRSLRRVSGRKPGGQTGHPGATLSQVATPDQVIEHEPGVCSNCDAPLAGAVLTGVEARQVFDLPPIRAHVIEHRLLTRECGCGVRTSAPAPAGVRAPVQYGPGVAAACVYLGAAQFLPKERTARTLSDLLGIPLSPGTVAAMIARASDGLDGFIAAVTARIGAAEVAHFDETGLRVDSKLWWVHSASTLKYSLITVHNKRGRDGIDAAGVLPVFTGIAVHDAWASYDSYENVGGHQLCGAHLLRELQAVTDTATENSWCWAVQASDALRELNRLVTRARGVDGSHNTLDTVAVAEAKNEYWAAIQIGIAQTAGRETKLIKKHNALARRMRDRHDDYLRFTHDPRIPFDNNAAEREIRMIKLRQKISGCLRTMTGAEQFVRIRSYLATAKKHGINHYDALTELATGHAWLPT